MRIGFDITPLSVPRTGVGTYTACLLAGLQKKYKAIFPLSHLPEKGKDRVAAKKPSSALTNKTVWMQLILQRQIKQQRLDLCHFTNHVAPLRSPCPYVLTIHDMTLWLYPSYHPLRRLAAMRPIIPLAARRAAAVITVSASAQADIVRLLGLPEEKIIVVYEAPDPIFRQELPGVTLAKMGQKYRLPARFLLHVGTLEPRKNLVRLLEAFGALHQHRAIPHHLVLVGNKGWHFAEIFTAVQRLGLQGVVHFLDYVPKPDLAALYRLADALVFPSLYEGFGLPVVEAMASGTPVITSNRGALLEVAGDAAVYLDPESSPNMAETICRTVNNRDCLADLRARGLAHAAQFSWEKAAEQTYQIYRQVRAGSQVQHLNLNPIPQFKPQDPV